MTYEEYKNNKEPKKINSIFKRILAKLFTIIIFTCIVVITSNLSPKFREFLKNEVLDSTMDFSKINNVIDKFTNVFNEKETTTVLKDLKDGGEIYLDGIKYKVDGLSKVYIKDSGIVTFIGEKEGYKNTVIIQQSNGYYAWYGNINETIKLYDYIEKGNEIGTADSEYYYVLYKDDKPITNED